MRLNITSTGRDHPRSRGEYSSGEAVSTRPLGSSPLSRGILCCFVPEGSKLRIIPALAGNTTVVADLRVDGWDHPRSRGEYPFPASHPPAQTGSSPLSRGIRVCDDSSLPAGGIIPALAGNTWWHMHPGVPTSDHPRSRGEYPVGFPLLGVNAGSSPLSRGILVSWFYRFPAARIIPALAGNTKVEVLSNIITPDHPRSRGEYCGWTTRSAVSGGSSPLSRGIPGGGESVVGATGIIPALAGNTKTTRLRPDAPGDHPRSRGEYSIPSEFLSLTRGSSPLSRGIRSGWQVYSDHSRIIPALAGNT